MGAWAGGVAQGISSKNAMKMQKEANKELTARMEQARRAFEARRPQVNSEKFAALQQQLGMFNPAIGMIGEMTGGRYAPNVSGMTNPMGMKASLQDLAGGGVHDVEDMGTRQLNQGITRLSRDGYNTDDAKRQLQDLLRTRRQDLLRTRRGGR